VGSLENRLSRLEDRMGTSADQASEARHSSLEEKRTEVRARLEAFEARLRNMSESEREARRNDPRRLAELQKLKESIERRRSGEH
jgi:hypothetical protein